MPSMAIKWRDHGRPHKAKDWLAYSGEPPPDDTLTPDTLHRGERRVRSQREHMICPRTTLTNLEFCTGELGAPLVSRILLKVDPHAVEPSWMVEVPSSRPQGRVAAPFSPVAVL